MKYFRKEIKKIPCVFKRISLNVFALFHKTNEITSISAKLFQMKSYDTAKKLLESAHIVDSLFNFDISINKIEQMIYHANKLYCPVVLLSAWSSFLIHLTKYLILNTTGGRPSIRDIKRS